MQGKYLRFADLTDRPVITGQKCSLVLAPRTWLLCFFSCLLSFAVLAEEEVGGEGQAPVKPAVVMADPAAPRVSPAPVSSGLRALAESLPADELLWLDGREFDPAAIMALYIPASHTRVRGGVLLLHDSGQHPDWPEIIGELRKEMPEIGWHTLSLAMIYPEPEIVPERSILSRTSADFPYENAVVRPVGTGAKSSGATDPDAAELNEADDTEDEDIEELTSTSTLPEAEVDIDAKKPEATPPEPGDAEQTTPPGFTNSQRIDLGLRQLETFGIQNRIMVGVGKGAEEILKFLTENPQSASRIQGMVWVNASFDHQALDELKKKAPGWLSIKILDIYDSTRITLKAPALKRHDFAKRSRIKFFQSSPIAGLNLVASGASRRLVNRVWSWQKTALPSRIRQPR